MAKVKIGVLALQGAFAKHIEMLRRLNVECCEVRKPVELQSCDGAIIPGGESTTILRQMWFIDLFESLKRFSTEKPLFGTCAGLILMSKEIAGYEAMKPFGILDVKVERNAFGRQVESFSRTLNVNLKGCKPIKYPGVFIRAPRVQHCGPNVKVLASLEEEPILVQEGRHLGATFHPELTDNPLIHEYFISLVNKI